MLFPESGQEARAEFSVAVVSGGELALRAPVTSMGGQHRFALATSRCYF